MCTPADFFRAVALLLLLSGCGSCATRAPTSAPDLTGTSPLDTQPADAQAARAVDSTLALLLARTQEMDDALLPIALLRRREQAALQQFSNRDQLARARALGVANAATPAARAARLESGQLVQLADSTAYWVLRKLDHSFPFVTPDVVALLTTLGQRFQDQLAALNLPPLRLEISSALRTADTQESLRTTNPNATRGVSTHEFGTTVDVAYSAFAAPQSLSFDTLFHALPADLQGPMRTVAALAIERVAAQRSRELQAILGRVLIDMQQEGLVMVTLEELQPVYHMTVARRIQAP